MLSSTLPYRQCDLVVLCLYELDVHVHMSDVLFDGSAGSSDGDEAGLDVDGDAVGHDELLCLQDVPHLGGDFCQRTIRRIEETSID